MENVRTKTVDSKGRVTLGPRFAGRSVIIREINETEVMVEMARVIPEREAWLYENAQAKASVARGLEQAKARQFSQGPDLDAALALAEQCEED